MKIRIMGLPDEVDQAIKTLTQTEALEVIEVSDRPEGPFMERIACYQPGQVPRGDKKQIT